MRNINEYKRRFDTLLESTMGNVKPLISEAPEFEEFVVPTLDMVKATNAYHFVEREDGSSVGEKITHKKSLSGQEYKITLSEGMYEPGEEISVSFKLDEMNPILKLDDVKSRPKGGYASIPEQNEVYLEFEMPMTQKELQNNSPFIRYADIFCKNVKGGILRFSVEVPSGSEIYEKNVKAVKKDKRQEFWKTQFGKEF